MENGNPDYYEILQVHPKASQEVIQNAYRALAKKYHPDIYPDKNEATKRMTAINNAYSVLSDSEKRKQYDNSLISKDKIIYQTNKANKESDKPSDNNISPEMVQFFMARKKAKENNENILEKPNIKLYTVNGIGARFYGREDIDSRSGSYITTYWFTFFYLPIIPLGRYRVVYKDNSYLIISKIPAKNFFKDIFQMYANNIVSIITCVFMLSFILYNVISPSQGSQKQNYKPSNVAVNQKQDTTNLPAFIPKNNVITQYVPNELLANNTGHCKITVDNSKNNFPVVVRIWSTNPELKPVRTFTIKQGEKFVTDNFLPGNYEIRYMCLYENANSNDVFKTEPFSLTQKETSTGTQFETITFTLYKVPHGNAKTYHINVNEL